MPTQITRRLATVGASAFGASAIAAPSGARPGDSALAECETSRAFPAGFLWGTATAAYQIEGAVRDDGRDRRSGTRSRTSREKSATMTTATSPTITITDIETTCGR